MKIDFRKIRLEDLAGNVDEIDVAKVFGNVVFNNTRDIAEYELSKRIYHDGEVDITEEQAQSLERYAEAFDRVAVRMAVKQALAAKDDGASDQNNK